MRPRLNKIFDLKDWKSLTSLALLILIIGATAFVIDEDRSIDVTAEDVINSDNSLLAALSTQDEEQYIEQETRFMTTDQHTVNDFTADILGLEQSNLQNDDEKTEEGDSDSGELPVEWGTRFFILREDGSTEEITDPTQDPVAIVSRAGTEEDEGIQSETYQMPETELKPEDALMSQVYIQVGDTGFEEVSDSHITESLDAAKIQEGEIEVFYYTEREAEAGGNPNFRFTTGRFYWGTSEFNSRIEGLTYELARVEAEQTNPGQLLNTYPGESFNHTVELTCESGECETVEIVPQACEGETCTNFEDISNLEGLGLSWEEESKMVEDLERDETASVSIPVEAEDEGEYRVRFNATPENIEGDITEDQLVDVHVSNPELTSFTHQNLEEEGINEYETGDTIEFLETEVTAFDGKAFELGVSPSITDSGGVPVTWGPDTVTDEADLPQGESTTDTFGSYEIPEDESPGEYTFNVELEWENFGPEANEENVFTLVNLRETFQSDIQEDSIFQEDSTEYSLEFTNEWSETISNTEIEVNCPEGIDCEPANQNQFSTVSSGETVETTFNVETFEETETHEYDINATVAYENPNEIREWVEVEGEALQVSASDALLTDIIEQPDNQFRAEYSRPLSNNREVETFGSLNGTEPMDQGLDSQEHWIYGKSNIPESEELRFYRRSEDAGGLNQTFIDDEGDEYCVFQTLPEAYNSCENQEASFAGFWTLDRSDTDARDFIGGNDGQIQSDPVQGVEAPIGRGFEFDGESDHIVVPENDDFEMSDAGEVTVSMWVNKNSINDDWTALLQKSDQSYNLQTNTEGEFEFTIHDGDYNSATGIAPEVDRWYHVAGVFDGSEIRIYVDGELEGAGSASNIGEASGFDIGIAENLEMEGRHFDGKMSGIRLYRRGLSSQEINALANPESSLGPEIEEPLSFPEEITRGNQKELEGSVENPDETAEGVTLEWLLPDGWDVAEGEQLKSIGTLDSGEKEFNNITADISLLAERGEKEIGLESDDDTGDRGELSTRSLVVYADTRLDIELNSSNSAYGQKVRADLELTMDTGEALSGQSISLHNQDEDEIIDIASTDDQGQASIEFEVKEDWEVGENILKAEYSQNETEFTRESVEESSLQVSDFPKFEEVTENPDEAGFGIPVTLNTSVTSEDGIGEVQADIESPSGQTYRRTLDNPYNNSYYTTEFQETWGNGVYNYNLTASTNEGFENQSMGHQFNVSGEASNTVVSDQDVYGPFENVVLDRQKPVSKSLEHDFSIMTKELSRVSLLSEDFSTVTGTSNSHTNTHSDDGESFDMIEQGGAPPDIPDQFEGAYTYETDIEDPNLINIESLGQVTGGAWEVSALNHDTGEFEEVYTITENEQTLYDEQICSGNACNDFIQNGEIEIRVFTQSDRDTDEFTYSVDYQEIEVGTEEGSIEGEENIEDLTVGNTLETRNRYYSRFDLDNLPAQQNAEIQSARLEFDVISGEGTGEVHHVQRFDNETESDLIHESEEPEESESTNPIETFEAEENQNYSIDITEALNQSFEASEDLALQLREEDETLPYELESEPQIKINLTTDSRLVNTGDLDMNGSLDMRVQRYTGGEWDAVGLPQVTPGEGRYPVRSSEELDLAEIWDESGGFNTETRPEGLYRVRSAYVDPESEPLEGDNGLILDTYEFEIEGADLKLSDVIHSNQLNNNINEFETTDNLEFVDVTIENNQSTAADARVDLSVLDELDQKVEWGPDSEKSYGDIDAGENETRRWDNSGTGYVIPEDASSGTFMFDWNATLDADNFEEEINSSFGFIIHDVPESFEPSIDADQNRVFRNESTLYNISMENPWSEPIENVEVQVQCDSTNIGCEGLDSGSNIESVPQIDSESSEEFSFNLSTDENTDIDDYEISASIEYQNPSGETKLWEERGEELLRVRIPGSLINLTKSHDQVTRGSGGYEFNSYTNNTFEDDLTNVTTEWVIPDEWNNKSGTLEEFREVQEPGELIYNNFTAEIDADAELGENEVRIHATNDQGREDDFIIGVDVFADTILTLNLNETQPAVNETVEIFGELSYDNGTAIHSQEVDLRDETEDRFIGSAVTDENGEYRIEYDIEEPEGTRLINASYEGSEMEFTNPQFEEEEIEVTGTPSFERVEALPDIQGYGKNTTLETELEGDEDIQEVTVDVEKPSGEIESKTKEEVQEDIYTAEFSSFEQGRHIFTVEAENEAGNTEESSSEFIIDINQTSSIQTMNDSYIPGEEVNLTTKDGSWWNQDWEFRSKIEASEISSNELSKYPSEIVLEELGDRTNSCEDLRIVQESEPVDLYIDECNPDGQTVAYAALSLESLETENLFAYYGNDGVEAYDQEETAYKIQDEGTVSSDTSLSVTEQYNDGNSVFRQIDITVFGDDLEASVEGLNRDTGEFETLYEGNPETEENIVDESYFNNPTYTQLDINLQDTSNNPGTVTYEYNYTTPEAVETDEVRNDEKLPSIIEDSGFTEFEGRTSLTVQERSNGEWVSVATLHRDDETQDIGVENLGELWNQDPWIPLESGEYRARFELLGPDGSVLQDGQESITADYNFMVGDAPTDVNIDNIEIYNVTDSTDPQDDFSQLKESGTNSTFRIPENERYRFDAIIENSDEAEADWEITEDDTVFYEGFNQSWNILDTNTDIFYENETERFEGGDYDGTLTWQTGGGLVSPGETARFSFILEIPEGGEERDIDLEIDDTTFTETDSSLLRIVEIDDKAPTPLEFDLNESMRRGEMGEASVRWDQDISEAEAEYDIVEENVLTNFSVTPENEYTNYTFDTDEDWFRGTHQFTMYGTDFSDNTNSTESRDFDVFGTSQIDHFEISPMEPEVGGEVVLECRIENRFEEPIEGYNVDLFEGNDLIESASTNSTGWVNSTYVVEETGEYEFFCVIEDDEGDFFLTPGESGFQSREVDIFVTDDERPSIEDFGTNVSRIFKTTEQDVGEFFADINHTSELDSAALTFGEYDTDNFPYSREINHERDADIIGAVNGTGFIDDGIDNEQHMIYGNLESPEGSPTLRYEDRFGGGLNVSKIEDSETGEEQCSFSTLPENSTSCQDAGDLVSYWTLDGYEDNAWDLIGENHGENIGDIQQSAEGVVGSSYDFSGTDQYVETEVDAEDLGIEGNEPKTVMAWANTRSFDDAGAIFSLGQSGAEGEDFALRVLENEDEWRAQFWGETDIDFTYPSNEVWVHFAIVHTGTETIIYTDGTEEASATQSLDTSAEEPFRIGWWPNYDTTETFDGRIDDVRVYNSALSPGEVESIYSLESDLGSRELEDSGDLPESEFETQTLEGESDEVLFETTPPSSTEPQDTFWNIHVNDTSGNINRTGDMLVDIWAWSFFDEDESGLERNPIEDGSEALMECRIVEGNQNGISGYEIEFYDNETGTRELIGTNTTNEGGYASLSKVYNDIGDYEIGCEIDDAPDQNIEVFDQNTFSEVLSVQDEVSVPQIQDDNYFINDSRVFIDEDDLGIFSQWDRELEVAEKEYNFTRNGEKVLTEIEGPYTDNWANATLSPNSSSWDLGSYVVRTQATSTEGGTNDTLEFQEFEVFSRSEVEWVEPEGQIQEQDQTDLVCRVYDVKTGEGISDYEVEYFDENLNFLGTNETDSGGESVLTVDTSGEEGEQEYSCRIDNDPDLFYETGDQDSDVGEFEFVDELDARLVGEIENPDDGVTLAKDKTFDFNATVTCRDSDCGEVQAVSRYNESADNPDTEISSFSGEPFHTEDENERVCGTLARGESCNLSFNVNATGEEENTYSLDVEMNSDNSEINQTEPIEIEINTILILNVEYEEVDFGRGGPGENLEGSRNAEDHYKVSLDENSNDADGGVWGNLSDIEHETREPTDGDEMNTVIPPNRTLWDSQSTCAIEESERFDNGFIQLQDRLNAGDSFTKCFFQEVPFGKYEGPYLGELTIKVNATN